MTLAETRTVIKASIEPTKEKHGIEWLEATVNYCKDKADCYELTIYISNNSRIKSAKELIYDNANEHMTKGAFELAVLKALKEVGNDSKGIARDYRPRG